MTMTLLMMLRKEAMMMLVMMLVMMLAMMMMMMATMTMMLLKVTSRQVHEWQHCQKGQNYILTPPRAALQNPSPKPCIPKPETKTHP